MIVMSKFFVYEGVLRNICFNFVMFGFIEIDMNVNLKDEFKVDYVKNIFLNRLGFVKEVVEVVVFFLSDYFSYIIGEIFKVNGGFYM